MEFDHCRAIIIENGKLNVIKREKNGRRYCTFPGGTREAGETSEQCLVREIKEELGIDVEPERLVYSYKRGARTEGFYIVKWISGKIHETDAEEYTWRSETNKFSQGKISMNKLKAENLMPPEVCDQLLKDYAAFGEKLCADVVQLEEKGEKCEKN